MNKGVWLFKTRFVALVFAVCLIIFVCIQQGYAEEKWTKTNSDSGFIAVIDDQAVLLQSEDDEQNESIMMRITDYCNVGFYTYQGEEKQDEITKAKNWGYLQFGRKPYLVFIIDMSLRKVAIYSTIEIYKIITPEKVNEILDTTFVYASNGEYGQCAYESFSLVLELLDSKNTGKSIRSSTIENIDLSGLSYDELVALKDRINLAIWNSQEWQEVTVPQGVWKVGEDIPAGWWTIKCHPEAHAIYVSWSDGLDDSGKKIASNYKNVYDDLIFVYSEADESGSRLTEYSFEAKEGYYIIIEHASAIFTPYTGKPNLGFK